MDTILSRFTLDWAKQSTYVHELLAWAGEETARIEEGSKEPIDAILISSLEKVGQASGSIPLLKFVGELHKLNGAHKKVTEQDSAIGLLGALISMHRDQLVTLGDSVASLLRRAFWEKQLARLILGLILTCLALVAFHLLER